jgi:hypothetical protein
MATSVKAFGAVAYKFGFLDTDAPVITNFVARAADLSYEDEVFATATDGEGAVDCIVASKPEKRKIVASFTGYINDGFDVAVVEESFTFMEVLFIVKSIGVPRKKGEFVEVTIEAEAYAAIEDVAP